MGRQTGPPSSLPATVGLVTRSSVRLAAINVPERVVWWCHACVLVSRAEEEEEKAKADMRGAKAAAAGAKALEAKAKADKEGAEAEAAGAKAEVNGAKVVTVSHAGRGPSHHAT